MCLCQEQENALIDAAMREGEYIGVRRFIRALERGMDSKALVDGWVDKCGAVINLRTAIMRYRKPRGSFRFYRCCQRGAAARAGID